MDTPSNLKSKESSAMATQNSLNKVKVVRFHKFGGPEVLRIEEIDNPIPKAGEVRIKVEAFGLNRAETLFRSGNYLEQPTFPSRLGAEAAGVVDAIGDGVTKVKAGDRVSVLPGLYLGRNGTYGESVVVPEPYAARYPESLTPIEAASIWVQYLTAYLAFVNFYPLRPGQYVLQTASTGGSGLGALEIARVLKAKTIVTTRAPGKRQSLLDAGADHVILTGSEKLSDRVAQITGGKGVDLVFDAIGGNTLPMLGDCVAPDGHIICYGVLQGSEPPYPIFKAMEKNFTLRSFTLYRYTGYPGFGWPRNDDAMEKAVQFITGKLADRTLRPIIAKTFALDKIVEAHRYLEANQQFGKVVVTT